jgi:peptidoglycan-associated lipoprotein
MKTTSPLAAGLAAAALLFAGCASDVKLDTPVPVESRSTTGSGSGSAAMGGSGSAGGAAGGAGQSGVASVDLNRAGAGAGAGAAGQNLPRVVYFDYDSFVVKDEFRPVVEGNARVLANDRTRRVQVAGHTDERGGREYNLALGQKRAEAVARAMTLLGAAEGQVEAVSYGAEQPAATGRDEQSYAQNRRAELNLK